MYLIKITAPNGDTATRQQGSWLDHAREIYGSWDRRLPPNYGLKLIDTYNNQTVLQREGDES